MPCENYKDALNSAAAGAPATRALRSHLVSCDACRTALTEEQALLASIDAGLHTVANTEVPPSLVPSVRVRLQESAPPRTPWVVPFLVPAAAALLVALFVAHGLRWFTRKPSENNSTASATPPKQPTHSQSPSVVAQPPQQSARAGTVGASRGPSSAPLSPRAAHAETFPEVLVPRDQEALLVDYAQQWRSHRAIVLAAAQLSDAPLKPMEVAPIQIDLLDVKPLADQVSR
jgi:hypothetical protein